MQVGGPPGTLWISPSVLHEETNMTAIGAVGIPPFGFVIAADGRKRLDYESRAKATADHRRTKPAWIEHRAHGLVPKESTSTRSAATHNSDSVTILRHTYARLRDSDAAN